jgi:hypothetical protein
MRDYTSQTFKNIQNLHRTGQFVGKDRPVGRVTWSKGLLLETQSERDGVSTVRYLDKTAPETEFFGIRNIEIDRSIGTDAATATIVMWNVSSSWTRPEGVDTGPSPGYLTPGRGNAKVPTMSVFNSISVSDPSTGGSKTYPTDWGYSNNTYRDVLVPNTVLRTYQGYGSDNFDAMGNELAPDDPGYILPKNDNSLYQTGVWLIDNVTFNSDGTITIQCRDLAKLLIEQYIYPPMIPINRFPLIYCPANGPAGRKESVGKNVAKFHSSSVDTKHGRNKPIRGHRGTDAFDSHANTYWLSNATSSPGDYAWLQAKVSGPINELVVDFEYGNCIVYVCIHEHGQWLGTQKISGVSGSVKDNRENLTPVEGNSGQGFFYVISPGDTLWDLAGTYYGDNFKWPIIAHANSNIIKDPHWIYPGQRIKIPYVSGTKSPPPTPPPPGPTSPKYTAGTKVEIPYIYTHTVGKPGNTTLTLPDTYDADYVRIVVTSLHQVGTADYRAAIAKLVARNHIPGTFKAGTVGKPGYIQDWNEPIREMCAWGGLTWVNPGAGFQADPLLGSTNGTARWMQSNPTTSTARTNLRVWGDFEFLGAGPVVCTPVDYFLSKSFMEGIRLIVDFIGGIFFIDEGGGAQFRLPNIWSGGSFIDAPEGDSQLSARVTDYPIEFHDDANVVNYQMTISDASLRSEILVIGGYPSVNSNFQPVAGGYVLGYDSATGTTSAIDFSNILAGQYRLMVVPGDSTKLFYTELECQRMAELTALFILFTYRQGQLTAPAHPGLQIDDQIRIYERVTNETNIHYVSSLKSTQDLDSGSYEMTATTHWLGGDPNTDWFVNKAQLTPAVLNLPAILARIGNEAGDGAAIENPPYGT